MTIARENYFLNGSLGCKVRCASNQLIVSVYRVLQMQGVGVRRRTFVLQVPDNKADAVPCERLPFFNHRLQRQSALTVCRNSVRSNRGSHHCAPIRPIPYGLNTSRRFQLGPLRTRAAVSSPTLCLFWLHRSHSAGHALAGR